MGEKIQEVLELERGKWTQEVLEKWTQKAQERVTQEECERVHLEEGESLLQEVQERSRRSERCKTPTYN